MERIQYKMASSVGPLYVVASTKGLQGVFFNKQKAPTVKSLDGSEAMHQVVVRTVKQIEEYLAGQRKQFNVDFDIAGTPFQMQVWRELYKIPFGKTVSYSDIARRINNPKAVRAVGSANGKNPICIIIPCHRVIAANGMIGGYGGGLPRKRHLLKVEGVMLPDGD